MASTYAASIRDYLRTQNHPDLDTKYSEPRLRHTILQFMNNTTLHKILLQWIYGSLFPALRRVDIIRYRHPIRYISIDACESDIPHKLGLQGDGKRKNLLDISTFRVVGLFNIPIGEVKFLELSGESYKKTYEQTVGSIIADNMRYTKYKGNIMHLFVSTDLGTEAKPEHVRAAFVNGLKQALGLGPDEYMWQSPETRIWFDIREFTCDVCTSCFIYSIYFVRFTCFI